MVGTFQDSLFSLIFPRSCNVCSGPVENRNDGVACSTCWDSTRLFDGSEMLCARCGSFFGDAAAPIDVYCHQCDDHFYDRAVALGTYEKAHAATVVNLKVQPWLPERIADQIRTALFAHPVFNVDVVIPAPLAPMRKLERGFNQADIIASAISRFCGVGADRSSLSRTTHTIIHRGGMDQKARALSVKKPST